MPISVVVDSDWSHFNELHDGASAVQDHYQFVRRNATNSAGRSRRQNREKVAYLEITTEPLGALFTIQPNHGLRISTWRSAGIARYAGLRPESYLALCSFLALTQWRVLAMNPLICPEDFIHEADISCLFATKGPTQDPALALEKLTICPGCRAFSHCLGADEEIRALGNTIRYARSGSLNRDDAL